MFKNLLLRRSQEKLVALDLEEKLDESMRELFEINKVMHQKALQIALQARAREHEMKNGDEDA